MNEYARKNSSAFLWDVEKLAFLIKVLECGVSYKNHSSSSNSRMLVSIVLFQPLFDLLLLWLTVLIKVQLNSCPFNC